MNDWVVESPSFEEQLINNRIVYLNQKGINEVVELIKNKNKEIERLKEEIDLCDTNKRVIKDLNKSLTEVHKEKERLKEGYCELKEKCNRGDCDCTKEEYNSICEANIKLYLEVDKLNKIIEIKTNRIQDLMKRLSKRTERIDKAIHRIQLIQMDGEVSIKDLTELVNILKGDDKE